MLHENGYEKANGGDMGWHARQDSNLQPSDSKSLGTHH